MIKGEGGPGYLKKGWGESRWMARYRLGDGIREDTERIRRERDIGYVKRERENMRACMGGMLVNRERKYMARDDRSGSGRRGRGRELVKKDERMEERGRELVRINEK